MSDNNIDASIENAKAETVTIAALLAFDQYPERDHDPRWLHEHCDASTYARTVEQLPHGGWVAQGYGYECAVYLTVSVDSVEAAVAASNNP